MEIKALKIESSEGTKIFTFAHNTIIRSHNNSVGKSTILRLLFYGLGYPIPGTYKLRFQDLKIWVNFERNGVTYTVYRHNKYLELKQEDKDKVINVVSDDMGEWFANIWGITSPEVLDNLLGAIYLEQDKGWTLLNRGKVIGDISFNVRDLLIGLSRNDDYILNLLERQKKQSNLLNEVKQILHINEISSNYIENKKIEEIEEINQTDDITKLNNLKVKAKILQSKIKRIEATVKKNTRLKDYLYGLHLMINNPNNPDNPINIDKDRFYILNLDDNIDYLKTELFSLQVELNNLKKKIAKLNNKVDDTVTTLFENKDVIGETLSAFSKISINRELLEAKETKLKNSQKKLNDEIDAEFEKNKEIINETQQWIKKFAEILDVSDIVNTKTSYIFTHDLKSISGTQYYKVVVSFKMAYIKVIENHTNTILPIVLDSPSGREVTKENVALVIKILNKYFSENQVIIASINKYDLANVKYIEIKNRIFE